MPPRTSTRFYRANRFLPLMDNSLSEKTVIPFPVSSKNRKDDPLCQQTIPREIQKPTSLQYEPSPGLGNGMKGLTIPKSNLYEKFRVRKNDVKFTASPRSLQPEKKFFIRRVKRRPKYALQLPRNRPISAHATRASGRNPPPRIAGNPATDFLRVYLPRYSPQPAPPPRARNRAPGARNAPWSARGRGQGASR